jgi:hypothetical protein
MNIDEYYIIIFTVTHHALIHHTDVCYIIIYTDIYTPPKAIRDNMIAIATTEVDKDNNNLVPKRKQENKKEKEVKKGTIQKEKKRKNNT